MKKAPARKPAPATSNELGDEYRFDYSKAKPNRFASGVDQTRLVVALDSDVSLVFTTPEAVNKALRALIGAMPTQTTSRNKAMNLSRPPESGVTMPLATTCTLNGRDIGIEEALQIRDARRRSQPYPAFLCHICGEPVRPHIEGTTGAGAHFEHHPANPDCPLSPGTH